MTGTKKTAKKTINLFSSEVAYNKLDAPHCVFLGDCLNVLSQSISADSVDLVFTSPPYADQRKNNYGGVAPADYVSWFLPRAEEIKRVLRSSGSFILNIKEKVVNGERHTYVLDLIMGMREQGWQWVEEYIWHKKNCYPGKWPNRFRDCWERLLHFTLSKDFKMRQDAVMVPTGNWAKIRLKKLSQTDKSQDFSKHKSGFGKKMSNWVGRKQAYPTNVIHLATECNYRGHPATFPVKLPTWFIRLFTDEGDMVLDPFVGSGTTLLAALNLNRCSIGIDIHEEFCLLARERLLK